MSTVVAVFDLQGMTPTQYEQIISDLETAGAGSPKGRLYHVASSTAGGFFVVDVWESAEQLNQFAQTLKPILRNAGVTPPQPQVYPAHSIIKG